MSLKARLPALGVSAALLAGVVAVVWNAVGPASDAGAGVRVDVTVPELSAAAEQGQEVFANNCAVCHGENGAGTNSGPPLIYDIYNPGHHDDDSFFRAAAQGVRRHHWSFGDMPPQPQVDANDMALLIQYVRELQVANGIVTRPHTM